jgi:hypothetical protein
MEVKMAKFIIELGSEVESNISGFHGIVTGRTEYLNGCNRYIVQPKVKKDDMKLPDSYWFDEMELIVISPPKLEKKNPDRGGPPMKVERY